jgi:hypothetical protein
MACMYMPSSCASSIMVSRRYHFDFQARRTNKIFDTGIFSIQICIQSRIANDVFSFKFTYILLHIFAVWTPLLASAAAIVLVLVFFGRNRAARAKVSRDQQSASWLLMACTAASQGVVIAEVDEDPRLGRLARRILPRQRRHSPLRRRCHFGLLSTSCQAG